MTQPWKQKMPYWSPCHTCSDEEMENRQTYGGCTVVCLGMIKEPTDKKIITHEEYEQGWMNWATKDTDTQ